MIKLLKVLVVSTISFFLFVAPSIAHTEVVSVEPDTNQTLTVLPTEVKLSFTEPVITDGTFASITSESGSVEASIRIEEANLFITIPQDITGTSFSIAYKTVASDGHPLDGELVYQLALEQDQITEEEVVESPMPISAPTSESNSDISWLQWLSLGAAIGVAITFFLKMRKK
ncbi:MAG: copper resistance protein CopC [Actinomycetes bacterium]